MTRWGEKNSVINMAFPFPPPVNNFPENRQADKWTTRALTYCQAGRDLRAVEGKTRNEKPFKRPT